MERKGTFDKKRNQIHNKVPYLGELFGNMLAKHCLGEVKNVYWSFFIMVVFLYCPILSLS